MNRRQSPDVLGPRPVRKEDWGVEPGHALGPLVQQPRSVSWALFLPTGVGGGQALTAFSMCQAL